MSGKWGRPGATNDTVRASLDEFTSGLITHRYICISGYIVRSNQIGSFRHLTGF
jgi:hypothetical protein